MRGSSKLFGTSPQQAGGMTLWSLAVLVFCLSGTRSTAQAAGLQGVSYTVSPAVEFMRWDEDLGLEDDELLGGRLSVNLGRTMSIQGYYFGNESLRTNLRAFRVGDDPNMVYPSQDVDLRNYGADVVFNLARGPVIPFVKGGAGILRFEPESGDRFNQVGLRAGGGLRFALFRRLEGVAYIENSMFRIDRTRLVPQSVGPETPGEGRPSDLWEDPERNDIRHNVALGVGVSFLLGGYSADQETDLDHAIRSRFSRGLGGASIPVEPFAGQLQFADDAQLDNQELVGIRGGLDFGRLLGLRAFYWRGVHDNFSGSEDIQGWGGEAQFNLSTGPGVAPFVILGAGGLDFMKGYEDREQRRRSDKALLILGGGLNINLSRRLNLNLTARDYIFSMTDLEETAEPDDLLHNAMFTVGLNFSLGGRADGTGYEAAARGEAPVAAPLTETEPMAETSGMPTAAASTPAEMEGAEAVELPATVSPTAAAEVDSLLPATPVRTYQGDRIVTLPVPTVGEIYIRYGTPGGVSIQPRVSATEEGVATGERPTGLEGTDVESLRLAIREAIREELAREGQTEVAAPEAEAAPPAPVTVPLEDQLDVLARRLEERIDSRIDRRVQEGLTQVGRPSETVVVEPYEPAAAGAGMSLRRVQVLGGLNADDPVQLVLGARMDLGPVSPGSPLRFVPELELGFVDETSYMATANVRWDISSLRVRGDISPYISTGFGLLTFSHKVEGRDKTEGVLNFSYGFTKDYGSWVGFIEHQGVDLYSLHRILVGVTLRM